MENMSHLKADGLSMQHQASFPFENSPQRVLPPEGLPQISDPPRLLPDSQLAKLVTQLEHLPQAVCYPLQTRFYETLLECDLLLPIPNHFKSKDPSQLPLMSLENTSGERCLPIFTNEAHLNSWNDEPILYMVLPFEILCSFALQAQLDYVVINASGPHGCEIPFHTFSYLAEGLLPPPGPGQDDPQGRQKPGEVVIAQQTPMRLGACENFSAPLLNRLQELFQHHQSLIEKVYLFSIGFHQGPLQPALAIQMPDEQAPHWENELWPNLQAVLYEMLEKRDIVNVFLLNEAPSLEPHLTDLVDPVYENTPRQ